MKNNYLFNAAFSTNLVAKSKYNPSAVVAWGKKPSSARAYKLAKLLQLPIITVEDGFLRSLVGGVNSKYGASFVADNQGIYFDLTQPNLLQELIFKTKVQWGEQKANRSQKLIKTIIENKLSKYNATKYVPNLNALANNDKKNIIIIDQVKNDASVAGAGASGADFLAMADYAKKIYPDANIWIKTHPEGKGYFEENAIHGVRYLTQPMNSVALLEQAFVVFTVSSHMGFEALLLDKQVHCFGVNWYSGFGLTDDDYISKKSLYQSVASYHDSLAKQYGVSNAAALDELFYAAYVEYSHYANPATCQACEIETVLDYLTLNRDWQEKFYGNVLIYHFSRWKLPFVRGFLGFPRTNLHFVFKKIPRFNNLSLNKLLSIYDDKFTILPFLKKPNRSYAVWGIKNKQILADKLVQFGETDAKIWCMEDGFIRSNGLGASLIAPLSVVMDDVGIYYDATSPSRLEQILTDIKLDDEEICRAEKLLDLLLTKRVSKYNVSQKNDEFLKLVHQLKAERPNTTIRLVVGQVEDDASVHGCASMIKTNAELLKRVRQDFPDDVIVYKPHPDVEAGLRVGRIDNQHLADVVANDVAMPDCLDVCDVVHTISSLTGFEGLLRGRKVVCYGLPFYAGFGLTTDIIEENNHLKINALARRQRTPLTLYELIIGTLVRYPLYHLPDGYGLATPEEVIDYLYNQPKNASTKSLKSTLWQSAKTNFMRLHKFTKQR